MTIDILKILLASATAFFVGMIITPIVTHFLYKYKVWKKTTRKTALDGTQAVEFEKLRTMVHTGTETKTPRMGGIVIWVSVALTMTAFEWLSHTGNSGFIKLDFLSRDQTLIPLVVLLIGAVIGFINDLLDISPAGERGVPLRWRLLMVAAVAFGVSYWFHSKLDVNSIALPHGHFLVLGWLIIPFFMFVMLSVYASGVIDGIDGLSAGVFAAIFAAYAIIAFSHAQINLAAFCTAMVGALLAFLWFNIPPARFWMTETGTMGITMAIATVAFMTDSLGGGIGLLLLPIAGILLVVTVLSNVIQIISKKVFKRKVFRVAPLHHHFEAIGWPSYKVTMRYWILAAVFGAIAVIISLTSV